MSERTELIAQLPWVTRLDEPAWDTPTTEGALREVLHLNPVPRRWVERP